MASKLAVRSLTEQEYLSSPKYEHCEYIDGEAVELNLGTGRHSNIRASCGAIVGGFVHKAKAGRAFLRLHCPVTVDGRRCYYLPDVAVILGDKPPDFRYAEGAPISLSKSDSIRTGVSAQHPYSYLPRG